MFQTKLFYNNKKNPYLFLNFIFAFFPISFILGSSIVNLNLFLFCCLGIYYLKSQTNKLEIDFTIKIILLFFCLVFFSTFLSIIKILYVEGFESLNVSSYPPPTCERTNCLSPLERFVKSILFFRFFLLLVIIYFLNKFDILKFKYFFLVASLSTILISLDIIYQYNFGLNLIGFKSFGFHNSGIFGDEQIAGSFIQRFAPFAILFTLMFFKNKDYNKFIFTVFVICILAFGVLFAGNRMPIILFIGGLLLLFLSNIKIKKIMIVSFFSIFIILKFFVLNNDAYKKYLYNSYFSFFVTAANILSTTSSFTSEFGKQKIKKTKSTESESTLKAKTDFYNVQYQSHYKRIYLTAIDTWKFNKVFGNGIKSFRKDCWGLFGPDVHLGEDIKPGKKNRLCSNHPHNYYLEILTETGLVGLLNVFLIGFLFIFFLLKNIKNLKYSNTEHYVLLCSIICLILETIPLKNTGSLFSTNNATYIILIASIVLCYKKLMQTKYE